MDLARAPTFMDPAKAGGLLRDKLDPAVPITIADAAARSGLALRDAEAGLTWLSSEYRGQLRVTADGDLVHRFPTGFTRPWEGPDARRRLFRSVARGVMGALRFVVRAWVTIVLVAYALLFVAIVIGLAFAQQGGDNRRSNRDGIPGGALAYAFFRVLGDALFWTFHPWSPFAVGFQRDEWGSPARRSFGQQRGPKVPLYERVNRFFFGPPAPPVDEREPERAVLAAIRAGKGRIGLADVMRVTGLPRHEADPLMARLMLDYEGDVAVSEEGGIVYRFEKMRRTASPGGASEREPPPAWSRSAPLPPLTGNSVAANFGIAALNAFNMAMGAFCLTHGLTLEVAAHLFDRVPHVLQHPPGTPVALGLVPLVFSALLFLLPIGRAVARPFAERARAEERGRLGVLREVTERLRRREPVTDEAAAAAWTAMAGSAPPGKRVQAELVALGGDVAVDEEGGTRWRFADLETEASALEQERSEASDAEAKLGRVVFATDR